MEKEKKFKENRFAAIRLSVYLCIFLSYHLGGNCACCSLELDIYGCMYCRPLCSVITSSLWTTHCPICHIHALALPRDKKVSICD
uniref:Uncharacterized protein n=1 Tax=Arundo donax TaxID=35708 RepID=A0A0A9F7X4_ARUDO